jgi:hypothetical protein
MEGPQFSTLAESELHRSWGASVIGMTNMPEAKLAREAELCYATVAMVTDFDAWHPTHDAVDVAQVVATMKGNSVLAKRFVLRLAADFPRQHPACPIGSDRALDHAIMTGPTSAIPPCCGNSTPSQAGYLPSDGVARSGQSSFSFFFLSASTMKGCFSTSLRKMTS